MLRYTPIYQKVKELLDEGVIGDVVSIMASENVGWYHQAHSFVRGNWANSKETSPMILQKCCHDMDLYLWLADKKCESLTSYLPLQEGERAKGLRRAMLGRLRREGRLSL